MNRASGTGSIDRSTRVRRLKRVIICLVLIAILLPTILCFFLFHRLNKLEEAISDLSLNKETISVITDNTLVKVPNVAEPYYKNDKLEYLVSDADKALAKNAAKGSKDLDADASGSADSTINVAGDFASADNGNADSDTSDIDLDVIDIAVDNSFSEEPVQDADINTDDADSDDTEHKVKKVYLTFDDGPSSNTHRILDILDEYGVKATFFVVGRLSDTTTPLYKRIVDEGHTIGMHSYSHKYSEIYASEDAFVNDINRIQTIIYEQTGVMPHYYRFPGGSSNTVSKVPVDKLKKILSNRGIIYYDWNVSSGDATSAYGLSEDEIVRNCINGAAGKDEVMILMHDLPEKFTTTEALPRIIEYFLSQGAEILPIDETSGQFLHD